MTYEFLAPTIERKGWTDDDEPLYVLELKALSFEWEASKHLRDEHGRFSKMPHLGLSHLLEHDTSTPWYKIEGAPAAVKLPQPKNIKPVSLRTGDVVKLAEFHDPITLGGAPKLHGDSYHFKGHLPDGTLHEWDAPAGDTVVSIARTPQPKDAAAAKKDLAAVTGALGEAPSKPHVASKVAGDLIVGDVMVDGDTGDQYAIKGVATDSGEVGVVGTKLNDPNHTITDLGVFKPTDKVTVKVAPEQAEKPKVAGKVSSADLPPEPKLTTAEPKEPGAPVHDLKPGHYSTSGGGTVVVNEDGSGEITDGMIGDTNHLTPHGVALLAKSTGLKPMEPPAAPDAPVPDGEVGDQLPAFTEGGDTMPTMKVPAGTYHNLTGGFQLEVGPDGAGKMTDTSDGSSWDVTKEEALDYAHTAVWWPGAHPDLKKKATAEDVQQAQAALAAKPAEPYLGILFAGHYTHGEDGQQGFTIEHDAVGRKVGAGLAKVTWDDGKPMDATDWSFIAPSLTPDGGGAYTHDVPEHVDTSTVTTGDIEPGAPGAPAPGRYVHPAGKILTVNDDGSGKLVSASGKVTDLEPLDVTAVLSDDGWSTALKKDEQPPSPHVGTWSSAGGAVLAVHEDGSGTWTTVDGVEQPYSKDDVDQLLDSPAAKFWSKVSADDATPPEQVTPSLPAGVLGLTPVQKPKGGWKKPALVKAIANHPEGTTYAVTDKKGKTTHGILVANEIADPNSGSGGWAAIGAMSGVKVKASPGYIWMKAPTQSDGAPGMWKMQPVAALEEIAIEQKPLPSVPLPGAPGSVVPEPGLYHLPPATDSTAGGSIVVHPDGASSWFYPEPYGPAQELDPESTAMALSVNMHELTKVPPTPKGVLPGDYKLSYTDDLGDEPDLTVYPTGNGMWMSGDEKGKLLGADQVYEQLTGADASEWSLLGPTGSKVPNPSASQPYIAPLTADEVASALSSGDWDDSRAGGTPGIDGGWEPGTYVKPNGEKIVVNADGTGTISHGAPQPSQQLEASGAPDGGIAVTTHDVNDMLDDAPWTHENGGVAWNAEEGQWAAGVYTHDNTGEKMVVDTDGKGTLYAPGTFPGDTAHGLTDPNLGGADGPSEVTPDETPAVDMAKAMAPSAHAAVFETLGKDDKVYSHPQGAVIVVHPDGSLTKWNAHGKKVSTTATAENLAGGHGAWTEVDPESLNEPLEAPQLTPMPTSVGAVPAGTYFSQKVQKTLVVHPDGSGTWVGSDADTYDIPPDAVASNFSETSPSYGKWSKVDPSEPVDVPSQVINPPHGGNASGNIPDGELTGLDPEVVKLAKQLDYPADYPWPQVPGAPPAKAVKGGTSEVKGVSLRPGDVVQLDGLNGISVPVTVVKTQKTASGGWNITILKPDGTSSPQIVVGPDETLIALARTPQPKDFAAMKKAKAQVLAHLGAPQAPAGEKVLHDTEVAPGESVVVGPGDSVWKHADSASTIITHPGGSSTIYGPDGKGVEVPNNSHGYNDAQLAAAGGGWEKAGVGPTSASTAAAAGSGSGSGSGVPYHTHGLAPGHYAFAEGDPKSEMAKDGFDIAPNGDATWTANGQSVGGDNLVAAISKGANGAKLQEPAPSAAAPSAPQLHGTGKAYSPAQLAKAKPKGGHYKVISAGAVVVLPKGGTLEITKTGYMGAHWEKDGHVFKQRPGEHKTQNELMADGWSIVSGGYWAQGIPSADAHPDYLSLDDEGEVVAKFKPDGGVFMWLPTSVAKQKGIAVPAVDSSQVAEPMVTTPITHAPSADPGTLSTSGWKQVGPQGGSNPGGVFEAADGSKFYVKAPKEQDRAENEVLAAKLYGAAGINIPTVTKAALSPELGLGTAKVGVASSMVDGKKNLSTRYKDAEYRAQIVDGFAVDAWLANWDAVGTGKDNIIEVDGKPMRVDVGGSLLFRAQGTPKGDAFSDVVGETKTMTAGNGLDSGDVYGAVSKAELKDSFLKHVAPITPDKIDQLVDSTVTDTAQRQLLKDRLKARRLDLAKQAGVDAKTLPENVVPDVPTVNVAGGTVIPWAPGTSVVHTEVTLGGTDQWFHTKVVPATQVPLGSVIFLQSDPSAPWVVTKTDLKPDDSTKWASPGSGGVGKMGLWGKKNGTGEEKFLMVQVTSQGERDVQVQVQPEPGWKPPPPPPPPTPGVKLDLTDKLVQPGAAHDGAAPTKFTSMWGHLTREKSLSNAWKLLTPEQRDVLATVALGDEQSFIKHFGVISANWDSTSNDSAVSTLAFQHACAVEFGLEEYAPWGKEELDMTLKSKVKAHFTQYGAAYQAAARAIYQNNQNEMVKAGVGEYVTVHRDWNFVDPETSPGNIPQDYAPAPPWAWSKGKKTIPLRPLQSFAWSKTGKFGPTHISATVPRAMIFSMGPTGPGGLGINEKELVLLAIKGVTFDLDSGEKPPKNKAFDEAAYYVKFPEWKPGTGLSVEVQKAKGNKSWLQLELKAIAGDNAAYYGPRNGWDANEDWIKLASGVWPFIDDDGDPVISVHELLDLYPQWNPRSLLDLPVGANMPPMLREEIESIPDDEDGIGPFAAATSS